MEAGKYLTFKLGKDEYGIPILTVKEIIGMMTITAVPKAPSYMKGVINLRGKIIPVMDLRLRFSLPEHVYTDRTCIIWVEILLENEGKQMGIIVDNVSEVVDLDKSQIEPPPKFSSRIEETFLTGIGKFNERIIMLLDINMVLNEETVKVIDKMEGSAVDV